MDGGYQASEAHDIPVHTTLSTALGAEPLHAFVYLFIRRACRERVGPSVQKDMESPGKGGLASIAVLAFRNCTFSFACYSD